MGDKENVVHVWDPFVRFFHWSLVTAYAVAWLTAEEDAFVHQQTGFFILGLLLLRIIWGLIGTRYARFTDFMHRPVQALGYLAGLLNGSAKRFTGHNPAGGWMIVLLLSSLAGVIVSGIFMQGGYGADWEEIHEFLANFTLVLVMAHLIGLFLSGRVHHENLVMSMISGRKERREGDV